MILHKVPLAFLRYNKRMHYTTIMKYCELLQLRISKESKVAWLCKKSGTTYKQTLQPASYIYFESKYIDREKAILDLLDRFRNLRKGRKIIKKRKKKMKVTKKMIKRMLELQTLGNKKKYIAMAMKLSYPTVLKYLKTK
jgi:protein-arginine kinase activator protein McsA